MFMATRAIRDYFTEKGVKFDIDETEGSSVIRAGFSGDNVSRVTMLFISKDNDNDVAFRAFGIVRVPEEKRAALLTQVNAMNRKYRYLKFCLDDDGDINMEFDFPLKCERVGEIAFEIFVRAMNIVDEAYPVFMKEIWS